MEFTIKNSTFRFKVIAFLVVFTIIATPILISANSVYAAKDVGTEGAKEVAVYLGGKIIGWFVDKAIGAAVEWAWKTVPVVLTPAAAVAALAFAAVAGASLVGLYLTLDGAVDYAIDEAGCRMKRGQNYWNCPNRIVV